MNTNEPQIQDLQKNRRWIRNFIILDIILLLAAVAAYMVWKCPWQCAVSSTSPTILGPTEDGAAPFNPAAGFSSSTFSQLKAGSVMAASVYPPNLSPVADDFNVFLKKVVASGITSQEEIDGALAMLAQQSADKSGGGLVPALAAWRAVDEISLAVFPGEAGSKHVVQILGELRTTAPEILNMVRQALDEQAKLPESPTFKFERLATDQYRGTLKAKDGVTSEAFLVHVAAGGVSLISEGMSRSDFLGNPTVSGSRLIEDQVWQSVKVGPEAKIVYTFSFGYDKLTYFFEKVQDLLKQAGNEDASFDRIADSMKQFGLLAGVMGFDRGLVSSQCMFMNVDKSDQAARYLKMLQGMSDVRSVYGEYPAIRGLIDATTVFAAQVPLGDLNLIWEYLTMSIPTSTVDQAAKDPSVKEVLDTLKRHEKVLKDFPFGEMNIALGVGGGGGFLPAVGAIFAGRDSARAKAYLVALEAAIDDVSKKPDLVNLVDDPLKPGAQLLRYEIQPGVVLTMGEVENGSLALALSPLTPQAVAERAQRPNEELARRTVQGMGMHEAIKAAQGSYYLSLVPVIEFSKPFLPMALQSAPPEVQGRVKNLDAVLDLLGVTLLMRGGSRVRNGSVVCTDGVMNQVR